EELEKLAVRQRAAADIIQQNQVDISWLRDGATFQGSRCLSEVQRKAEIEEKLEDLQQRVEDLARQAKTEQLRSIMLR
ncbi:unnamed protein product, partial [Symbiodinium pilosum]